MPFIPLSSSSESAAASFPRVSSSEQAARDARAENLIAGEFDQLMPDINRAALESEYMTRFGKQPPAVGRGPSEKDQRGFVPLSASASGMPSVRQGFVPIDGGELKSPGLIDRIKAEWNSAVANKKDFSAPITTNESSFFGFPSLEKPPVKSTGSVMDGFDGSPDSVMAGRGAPVRQEVYDATRSHFDAATPSQRDSMAQRGDWLGSVATAIDDGYKAQPAGLTSVDRIDPRAEKRTARLVGDGVESDTARSIAKRSAKSGVLPGDEVSGAAKESNFDFDKANEARGEGQVGRGLEKGYLGLKNQALGIHKFIADTVGADAYGNAMQAGRDKNSRAVDAIGTRSEYLTRNFEGAIASIVSNTPGMLAGFVTGSSAIPLAMMGAQVFGDEYANGIEKGQSYTDATGRAGLFAAAEVIGEKLAIGDTIKALKSLKGLGTLSNKEVADEFAKHIIRSSLKEIPGEELTTTLQFLTDKIPNFGHNPEAGLSDYLQQVGDTFTATVMQSAMMAGGGRAAIGAHKLMTDRPASGGQTASDAIDSQRSADLAQQSALDGWASRVLAPSANSVQPSAPQLVAPQQDESGAVLASDLYGDAESVDPQFQDIDSTSGNAPAAELTDMAAPAEMGTEAAAVETTLQRAYGDNPVLVDLITSQGGGLGLGGMAETLARVAPKVAAAKDLIESARAARQNAEIAAEQEAIITAEVAQAAEQPQAIGFVRLPETPVPVAPEGHDAIAPPFQATGGISEHEPEPSSWSKEIAALKSMISARKKGVASPLNNPEPANQAGPEPREPAGPFQDVAPFIAQPGETPAEDFTQGNPEKTDPGTANQSEFFSDQGSALVRPDTISEGAPRLGRTVGYGPNGSIEKPTHEQIEDLTPLQKDLEKIKTNKAKGVPLHEITVQVDAIVQESGERVSLSEKADEAFADVDRRIELVRGLLECLAS